MVGLPYLLEIKAEALHLADRTFEALEAEALVARCGERRWCVEPHRLKGVFLAAMDAEENQIEASFCEAIRVAKKQKSVSLEKRAKGERGRSTRFPSNLFANCLQRSGFPSGDPTAGSFDYPKAMGYARANFVTSTIWQRTSKRGLRRRRMGVEDERHL